jgi:opacity protein-like surface antigen
MKKLSLLTTLLASLFCVSAFADTGPFIEANLGSSSTGTASLNQSSTNFNLQSKSNLGWNVNAGVMFLGLGAEAGYTSYGEVKYQQGDHTTQTNLTSTHLALRATPSIFGPLYLLGKIGYAQLSQGSFDVNNINVPSRSGSGLLWGVGVGLKFLPMLYAQLQYQQVQGQNNLPTTNITMLGVGFGF